MKNFSRPDLTPGPVRYTGNQLDVALEAPGFFKVQTSKGIKYSKDGSFTLNKDQFLVNQRGDTVLGQGGPIQITGNKVSISTDGSVVVDDAPLDRILVVDFKHPQLLTKEGSSYFTYKGEEQDISTAENVNILQGYIETSNVNPTEEMIKMLETFRVFESAQKAIQSLDEITGKMVNDQGIF
jgi:flagellar basal-body rod protein FlgG